MSTNHASESVIWCYFCAVWSPPSESTTNYITSKCPQTMPLNQQYDAIFGDVWSPPSESTTNYIASKCPQTMPLNQQYDAIFGDVWSPPSESISLLISLLSDTLWLSLNVNVLEITGRDVQNAFIMLELKDALQCSRDINHM